MILLANVGFHEKEEVEQQGRDGGDERQPDLDPVPAKGVDQPPAGVGSRHLEAVGHVELLGVGVGEQEVDGDHDHDGQGHAEIAEGPAGGPAQDLAVLEDPQVVGDAEGAEHEEGRQQGRVGLLLRGELHDFGLLGGGDVKIVLLAAISQ